MINATSRPFSANNETSILVPLCKLDPATISMLVCSPALIIILVGSHTHTFCRPVQLKRIVLLALILELLSRGSLRILGTSSVNGGLSIYPGVKTDCAMQAWYLMSGEHTGRYLE
jgi:hypothetical protein